MSMNGRERCLLLHHHRLIHMGVRHDSVVANDEETGSTGSTWQVEMKRTLKLKAAERVGFKLRRYPLNGDVLVESAQVAEVEKVAEFEPVPVEQT